MLIKLIVFIGLLYNVSTKEENHSWELAVVTNDEVQLLNSNGSLVGIANERFTKLKALTYDSVRHQFVVSDMDQKNDTIFTVHLTKETDITPIIQDLPDDVQGLTIDPVSDVLYWTDSINKTINYVSLSDPLHKAGIFLEFKDKNPQDIAIDACRRYIYWTNSNIMNPTIERVSIDGKQREILVNDNIFMPAGIAVDYASQRIYWADMSEGIYYKIESTDFKGGNRQILYQGTHQKPFGIAVDKENVYWTDVNNNALWRKKKFSEDQPEKIRSFDEKPMGLVARNKKISLMPDCHILAEAEKEYNITSEEEYFEVITESNEIIVCLNEGILTDTGCKCSRGFIGKYCEMSLCFNYCVHGDCHYSSMGTPKCHCPPGLSGSRCERNLCDDFCLNYGDCTYSSEKGVPQCTCPEGFTGERCEISLDPFEWCSEYCQTVENGYLLNKNNMLLCRCSKDGYTVSKASNISNSQLLTAPENDQQSFLEHLEDPLFITSLIGMSVLFVIVIGLSILLCKARRRPRIKKRVVVNKNITPLTYRAQPPTELCEITIENCCNMNVCETPCFEPPQLRFPSSRKDEKKTLLTNMENGDDLY